MAEFFRAKIRMLVTILFIASSVCGFVGPAFAGNTRAPSFDMCGRLSDAQIPQWWTSSPYWASGYYLGGWTSCDTNWRNAGQGAAYLNSLEAEGFNHYPYFVGRQPVYTSASPTNPICSIANALPPPNYQITSNAWYEGFADAVTAVGQLGTRMGRPNDNVLILDIENYNSTDQDCYWLTSLYITAWALGVSSYGKTPVLYSSVGGSNGHASFQKYFLDIYYPGYSKISQFSVARYNNQPTFIAAGFGYALAYPNGAHQYTTPVAEMYGTGTGSVPINRLCVNMVVNGVWNYVFANGSFSNCN